MTFLQQQRWLNMLFPLSVYITLIFNTKSKNDLGTFLNRYEKVLTKPLVLTLLVLFTKTINDYSKPKTPKYLINMLSNPLSRYIGLVLITFTLTRDIELSFITTFSFLIMLQLLRTDEERYDYPYLI